MCVNLSIFFIFSEKERIHKDGKENCRRSCMILFCCYPFLACGSETFLFYIAALFKVYWYRTVSEASPFYCKPMQWFFLIYLITLIILLVFYYLLQASWAKATLWVTFSRTNNRDNRYVNILRSLQIQKMNICRFTGIIYDLSKELNANCFSYWNWRNIFFFIFFFA